MAYHSTRAPPLPPILGSLGYSRPNETHIYGLRLGWGYIDVAALDVPNVAVPDVMWAAQDRVATS